MAWQLPHGVKKGPMEETFERLEAAMQRLPASEHTPEMLLLAASHKEFRVAVHYAWDATAATRGEGPPLSQDNLAKLIIATMRACSLGMQATGAYSMPDSAVHALLCHLRLGTHNPADPAVVKLRGDFDDLTRKRPPPITRAMQALEAVATSLLASGLAPASTGEASSQSLFAGLHWMDAAIDSMWPLAESWQQIEARMEAQAWVPAAPTGGSGGAGGAAGGISIATGPTAVAAEMAALLRRVRPDLSMHDLYETCLVVRCSTRHHCKLSMPVSGSPEYLAILKAGLVDCQQLMALQPASLYPRHHAAGLLDSWRSNNKDAGSPDPEWRFLKESWALAIHAKWYRAAAGFNHDMAVRLADLVQASPIAQLPQAQVAEFVDTMALLMKHTKEYERKLKPWLPSRRLNAVADRRKRIEAKIAAFHATGRIEDSSIPSKIDQPVCDACGTAAMHLRACSACRAVRYCSRECQLQHWKEGGHKAACAQLAAQRTQRGAG